MHSKSSTILAILLTALCSCGSLFAGVLRVEFKNLQQVADTVTFDIETVLLDDTFDFIDSLTLAIISQPSFPFTQMSLTPASGWDGALDTGTGLVDLTATPGQFPDPAPARLIYNQPQIVGSISIDTRGLPNGLYRLNSDETINSAFGVRNGGPEIVDGTDIQFIGNRFAISNAVPEPVSASVFITLAALSLSRFRRRSVN